MLSLGILSSRFCSASSRYGVISCFTYRQGSKSINAGELPAKSTPLVFFGFVVAVGFFLVLFCYGSTCTFQASLNTAGLTDVHTDTCSSCLLTLSFIEQSRGKEKLCWLLSLVISRCLEKQNTNLKKLQMALLSCISS